MLVKDERGMIELGGTVLNDQKCQAVGDERCAEVGRPYRMSGFGGQGDRHCLFISSPWLNHSLSSRPPRPGQPPNVFFFLLFHKTRIIPTRFFHLMVPWLFR